MNPIPYDVFEAMVQCFGCCFHYKDGVASFLMNCGVERRLVERYRDEPKFVWARHVLTELGQSEDGCVVQRKILTCLCSLKDCPDPNIPDRDRGLQALRKLKELALSYDLVAQEEIQSSSSKRRLADEKDRIIRERAARLEDLRQAFGAAVANQDRQTAGFTLEDLLRDLFSLFEIEYRKSYRTSTQQIDGHFSFQNFDYLVEARWRQDQPTEQELGGFKHKVDGKLESTRGLFVSVPGFRPKSSTSSMVRVPI